MKPSCNARSICVWHRYSHEIALKASRCHFAKLMAEVGWPTSTTHSQTAHLHQTYISRFPDTASRIRWQNSAFALWAETFIIEPQNVDRLQEIFRALGGQNASFNWFSAPFDDFLSYFCYYPSFSLLLSHFSAKLYQSYKPRAPLIV